MGFQTDDIAFFNVCFEQFNIEMCITLSYRLDFSAGTSDIVTVEDLLDSFQSRVIDAMMPELHDSLVLKEVKLDNLTDRNVFGNRLYNLSGGASGDPLPPFMALTLSKAVNSRITRPGSIRVPGMSETSITNGVWTNGQLSGRLAVAFRTDLVEQSGAPFPFSATPVIVGRNPDGSFDLTRINEVVDFGSPKISTQNSRKR